MNLASVQIEEFRQRLVVSRSFVEICMAESPDTPVTECAEIALIEAMNALPGWRRRHPAECAEACERLCCRHERIDSALTEQAWNDVGSAIRTHNDLIVLINGAIFRKAA